MLHTFAPCDPFTKSQLLHSFCLSLYGSALWLCLSSELKSLEVSFNNIIRKIWSLFGNVILRRCISLLEFPVSYKLTQSALASTSPVVAEVFRDSIYLVYTSTGHNYHYGHRRWKYYTEQDILSAKFVIDVKLAPDLNSHLEDDLLSICCA